MALTRMLQRRGTADQWADVANSVVLAPGEIGLVIPDPEAISQSADVGKFKIGDGTKTWSQLSYRFDDAQNQSKYSRLVATQTFEGSQVVTPANAATIPLVVAGKTSQSAHLTEWRDVNGNILGYVGADGLLSIKGATFNANVEMNNHAITGLKDIDGSSTDNYAVNKKYVDEAIAGLAWKAPVNLISASDLDTWIDVPVTGTSGTLVLDGHPALDQTDSGYRLLLVNQSTASNDGIWVYTDNGTSYTLARPTDADTAEELRGASVFVQEGTHYGTSSWVQTDHYLSSLSNQVWVQFNGASQINAGDGLTKLGNTLNAVAGQGITVNADSIQITDLGITTGMLAADAVTNAKLADNAVENANIANDAVDTDEIKDGAVTSAKIANGTIVNEDINAAAAITQTKIASNLGNANIQEDIATKSNVGHTHTLDNLSDVVVTTPAPGQALTYSSANGGEWINSTPASTLNDLTDVTISSPVDKQTLVYEESSSQWKNKIASGGVSVSKPENPIAGDAWFDNVDGGLYIWYVDADGGQWVEIQTDSAFGAAMEPRVTALEEDVLDLQGRVEDTESEISSLETNKANISGATFTGIVTAKNYNVELTTESSDSIALDFSSGTGLSSRIATGSISFTASNYSAGSIKTVRVVAGASSRSLSFPSSWSFLGVKPTSILANKVGILTITSFGTSEADCVAAWSVQA